jgi:predicted PurR-regulated permease PerM
MPRQHQPLSASCSSLVISSVVASRVRFTTLAALGTVVFVTLEILGVTFPLLWGL